MTIHDDAQAAFRAVYDTEIDRLVVELNRATTDIEGYKLQIEECTKATTRATGERDAALGLLANAKEQIAGLNATVASLNARIKELESQATPTVTPFRPVKFANLDEAKRVLGAPADANYVVWKNEWTHLEQAFAAMSDNDILVLPERAQPYLIDSSKGFMASGVKEITGPNGTRTPVISNVRLWFAMSRARRGILGLGPGVVIAPSASSWTAPAQPKPLTAYFSNGSSQEMVGSANKLIEANHTNPFFANFELQGRDFGGVSYNGIALDGTDRTVKNIFFNGCWRGFSGEPNGETGGLSFLKGVYTVDNCEFNPVDSAPSPIMWNRTTGGTLSNVKAGTTALGMFTYWRCGGKNVWKNVTLANRRIGLNLEENLAGFELEWTGGAMLLERTDNSFHLNMNPSNGSQKLTLKDVKITGSYTGQTGKLIAHIYTTAGKQRKSDVTWDGGQVAYLPETNWL